ncbi:Gfo/Idh/MocA family protein [Bradyrhizobium zhanjiangense]|uniref:Gfo/Idh/MocA family protein n=1 Tax=Bradyrhizobium zhanjiangense TaxID=1325107 RepID=UPI0010086B8D|nr:Gfo/Idh/MocA family oxidoreductase [Bradyrhizobium zhanjiangense]
MSFPIADAKSPLCLPAATKLPASETTKKAIGVGIIGTGGWAKYGHIAALQTLDEFKIIAIGSRKQETADAVAKRFDIPHAFADDLALINHPEVELVAVVTPALDHARLARLVIAAGKDVYSEWPLSTTTAESKELLALAKAKGVRHVVGLQRRFGPSSQYLQDLIKQNYVGQMRSARMTVSVDAFENPMSQAHSWSFDIANFAHTLSIYGGHFQDLLFNAVGFPNQLTAIVRNQFPLIDVIETGEKVPTTRPDAAMMIGTLENGALFSVQIEGAQHQRTGLQIDITGTEGVLRVTNVLAFLNKEDNAIEGMRGKDQSFSPMPVPAEYQSLANVGLAVSQQDVAFLYRAYAQDRRDGTSQAANFADAVRQHQLIDQMFETSKRTFG